MEGTNQNLIHPVAINISNVSRDCSALKLLKQRLFDANNEYLDTSFLLQYEIGTMQVENEYMEIAQQLFVHDTIKQDGGSFIEVMSGYRVVWKIILFILGVEAYADYFVNRGFKDWVIFGYFRSFSVILVGSKIFLKNHSVHSSFRWHRRDYDKSMRKPQKTRSWNNKQFWVRWFGITFERNIFPLFPKRIECQREVGEVANFYRRFVDEGRWVALVFRRSQGEYENSRETSEFDRRRKN